MEGICRRLALAAALVLVSGLAHAGKGISGITLKRESNLTSVAVQAIVSGDDDSTAVLRLFQKWRENPAFDTGMVLVRRPGTNIHEGRILWMTPGRFAHWYVEGRDGSERLTTPLQLARVDQVRAAVTTGPVFYADQRHGDDRWDGTSRSYAGGRSGPTRTIGAALRSLAASPDAGRNGGVFVAPGEYHEPLRLDFGPDGAQRFLSGDGSDRDSTIVCGANPWVERGLSGPGQPLVWTALEDSVWVTPFPAHALGSSPGDSTQLVVVGWGEYLHRKTSLRAVLDDSTWAGRPESTNAGELSGWYWQDDSLYVKRANGESPAGQVLHTGYLDALLEVQRRNWRIANLTFRFAGGTTRDPAHPANPDPPLSGHGIVAGLIGAGSGLVIDSCRFYGHNADAIYIVHGALGGRADSVTIAHCLFDGLTIGRMAYGAGKARAEERAGQVTLLSRASNVFDNSFEGSFNGLAVGPGSLVEGPRDSTWGSQLELAYNRFRGIADDAIELDTSHAINTLLFGNTIRDCGHGISQTPVYTGPVFAFYNTIADTHDGGLKVGAGTTAVSWYAQNTFTAASPGGWVLDGSPGGPVENLHFRNNVLTARGRRSGYTIWGPGVASRTSNDFDYDLIDSVSTLRLVLWNGAPFSFPQLQSQLGWERHGLRASPLFVDSAGGDWNLGPASPGIAIGLRMTGINTSLDGPRYRGAPDVGARALPPLAAAPIAAEPMPRLSARGAPNPSRSDGALEFVLPVAAEVSVRLYDPAGRIIRTLLERAPHAAGTYRLPLAGLALPAGLYFYQVRAGSQSAAGKLVWLE